MPHTEQEILTALRHSREEGFVLLLESFQQPIYWHIRRLVVSHHDSEDITQEAFMRIYKGLGWFRGEASLKTWVYRIATNEALRWLGKRKAEEGLWVHGEKSALSQEPYINYNDLEAIELQRAIASLPRRQQLVFNLCYYDDMDYEQVEQSIKAQFAHSRKAIDIREKYYGEFRKILNPRQIQRVYELEKHQSEKMKAQQKERKVKKDKKNKKNPKRNK